MGVLPKFRRVRFFTRGDVSRETIFRSCAVQSFIRAARTAAL